MSTEAPKASKVSEVTPKHYKVVAGSDLDGMENYPLSEQTIIGDLEAYLNRQHKAGWRFVAQLDRWLYDEQRQFLVFEPTSELP